MYAHAGEVLGILIGALVLVYGAIAHSLIKEAREW